jgi:hypothetical protein
MTFHDNAGLPLNAGRRKFGGLFESTISPKGEIAWSGA